MFFGIVFRNRSNKMNMCYKRDLLNALNNVGSSHGVLHAGETEPLSCSFRKAGGPKCPTLMLKAQRITGDFLVSSLSWKTKRSCVLLSEKKKKLHH